MYASIYKAHKKTGYSFELIIHATPAIDAASVQQQIYFVRKVDAKNFALRMNLTPWNY